MTCIVGLVDDGVVYIGGDSAAVSGMDITVRVDRKVFKNGPFVMGFTSSFRMGQLLAYKLTPPVMAPGADAMGFMVSDFVESVRTCLRDGGFTTVNNSEESGGTFLVGYAGRLFTIDSDFQVGESVSGYAAVGCGAAYALGALQHIKSKSPAERVTKALETAASLSAGVCGPFNIVTTTEPLWPGREHVEPPHAWPRPRP